jgi:uncharacterized damage-inducible protein DinB
MIMPIQPEIELYWDLVADSVDRILASMEGLSGADLNRRPVSNASSLYVLAVHTMGNIEHNILRQLCGGPGERDRDAEFAAEGESVEPLTAHWADLQARINAALSTLPAGALQGRYVYGRYGEVSGPKLLLLVARHAAEHCGHAELTRDVLRAR